MWHEAHVAGQRDEVHVVLLQEGQQADRARLAIQHRGRDAGDACALEGAGVGPVAGDQHDPRRGDVAPRGQMVEDRLQVRPASRGEHGHAFHAGILSGRRR